jgi:hypothetical protein
LHGLRVDAFAQFDGGTAKLAVDQAFERRLSAAFLRASRQSGHETLDLDVLDRGGVLEQPGGLLDERDAVAAQHNARRDRRSGRRRA